MWIFVFQILVYDGGIVDHEVVIDQHRYLAEGVHLEEFRALLLGSSQIDVDQFVRKLLLGQNDSDLLAEGALRVVVELHLSVTSSKQPPT